MLTQPSTDTREDDLLIQFFRRWAPFGGGPAEDIMVTFGITRSDYVQRLYTLACGSHIRRYPTEIKRQILRYCDVHQDSLFES